jgi:hypothetical protein
MNITTKLTSAVRRATRQGGPTWALLIAASAYTASHAAGAWLSRKFGALFGDDDTAERALFDGVNIWCAINRAIQDPTRSSEAALHWHRVVSDFLVNDALVYCETHYDALMAASQDKSWGKHGDVGSADLISASAAYIRAGTFDDAGNFTAPPPHSVELVRQ